MPDRDSYGVVGVPAGSGAQNALCSGLIGFKIQRWFFPVRIQSGLSFLKGASVGFNGNENEHHHFGGESPKNGKKGTN